MIRLFIFILLFLNSGCKSNSSILINLSEYDEYSFKQEHTTVILIQSFIDNNKCNELENIYYSNVFMCKTAMSNDTILVFTFCKDPYDFLKDNYKGEKDLIIDKDKVSKNYPKQLLVNLDSAILKRKFKYVVGDITKLEY